jgi:hypothetical protein
MWDGLNLISLLLTIAGLCLFESVTSIDNAVINADVLATMSRKGRRWFLFGDFICRVRGVDSPLAHRVVGYSFPCPIELSPLLSAMIQGKKAIDIPPHIAGWRGTFLIFFFNYYLSSLKVRDKESVYSPQGSGFCDNFYNSHYCLVCS